MYVCTVYYSHTNNGIWSHGRLSGGAVKVYLLFIHIALLLALLHC